MPNSVSHFLTGSKGETFNLAKPKQFTWNPKEDITAYELALSLPIVANVGNAMGMPFGWASNAIESLPENDKRHWEEVV